MLHKEILNKNQLEILPLISLFCKEYYLVGGTAIALHIGHRRSIDFDLFKNKPIRRKKNLESIQNSKLPYSLTYNTAEQMNFIVNDVKLTFFQYEFSIKAKIDFDNVIKIPTLIDLAAMKAYALGRRSKWKDYVDLYFLLKEHFTLEQIALRASEIFGELFSNKMFRVQLSYFDDIDYSESVDFMIDNPPTDIEIRSFLEKISTDIL